MVSLPIRVDAVDKRILIFMSALRTPLEKKDMHRMVYEMQSRGVRFGFEFIGKPPFSEELQRRVDRLVKKGYLQEVLLVKPEYFKLYSTYYLITERGEKIAKRMDVDKKDIKRIIDYVEGIKSKKTSQESGG